MHNIDVARGRLRGGDGLGLCGYACVRLPCVTLLPKVLRIIEHLDPAMSGRVNWHAFVRGGAEAPKGPPYFFNGDEELQLRTMMKRQWEDVLAACRDQEKKVGTRAMPSLALCPHSQA